MNQTPPPIFLNYFNDLDDPRMDRKKMYPMNEILLTIICGSICGASSWRDFVTFGLEKLAYLKRFLPYKNGIPSKNTFARVLSLLDPSQFKVCFISWVKSFQEKVKEVIAIDGKTLCKSFNCANDQSPIHLVSAFASQAKLVLGQEKMSDKSNEITAIPKLLDLLAIEETIISIDAMGTQKKIAQKIREKKADYVLALKKNQRALHEEVVLFLSTEVEKFKSKKNNKIKDFYEYRTKGHGRIEHRQCYITESLTGLSCCGDWQDLKCIAMV